MAKILMALDEFDYAGRHYNRRDTVVPVTKDDEDTLLLFGKIKEIDASNSRMATMVLTVKKARINDRILNEGDEFEVPEEQALTWFAMARAKLPKESKGYKTAAVRETGQEKRPYHRNRYRRSDMRAED
jgi:hypothetical protein